MTGHLPSLMLTGKGLNSASAVRIRKIHGTIFSLTKDDDHMWPSPYR